MKIARASLFEAANLEVMKAPANVPNAWANQGAMKLTGGSLLRFSANVSMFDKSTPSGSGITCGPTVTIAMLTTLPSTIP
ncbi:MAG: hypothetical protein MUD03_17035, partial [Pirellula sp.]|nr:hypothetical protein [Pirellula sp.]